MKYSFFFVSEKLAVAISNENLYAAANTSGFLSFKDKSLNASQQANEKYLLKEILNDQDSSYIKIFQLRKSKSQKFGLVFDENKTFNCKVIKKINKNENLSKNSNLAVGDLILCINNEIKFNDLTCKQLENYLDGYHGHIRILLLSKENVEKLLHAQNEITTKPRIIEQSIGKQLEQQIDKVEFDDNDEASANYNTTTQMITKPTTSQIFANIDKLSIRSSYTSDQDSVDFEYLSKMNKTKSIKGLFSIAQPTDKNDAELMNLSTVKNSNSSTFTSPIDENFLKIDHTKIFKATLQKNENNELGFTVTKLPNGFSCIKEILHEPATLNRSIQTGDVIVSVNKSAIRSLTHRDVVTYLRISASTVELELFRPDPEIILPYLNQRKQKQIQYSKSFNKNNLQEENNFEIDGHDNLEEPFIENKSEDRLNLEHDDTVTENTVS